MSTKCVFLRIFQTSKFTKNILEVSCFRKILRMLPRNIKTQDNFSARFYGFRGNFRNRFENFLEIRDGEKIDFFDFLSIRLALSIIDKKLYLSTENRFCPELPKSQ